MTQKSTIFLHNICDGLEEPDPEIICVFICKLRKKLATASEEFDFIETVWGRGYVLQEPTEQSTATSPVN